MTAHELARKLLEMPDIKVADYYTNEIDTVVEYPTFIEVWSLDD